MGGGLECKKKENTVGEKRKTKKARRPVAQGTGERKLIYPRSQAEEAPLPRKNALSQTSLGEKRRKPNSCRASSKTTRKHGAMTN